MGKKVPIINEIKRQSGGAANEDLLSFPLDTGVLLCIQRICFENEDNACTEIRIGLKRGTSYVWVESFETTAAGTLYSFVDPIWVPSEYQVVVRFVGSVAADDLYMVVLGYSTTYD